MWFLFSKSNFFASITLFTKNLTVKSFVPPVGFAETEVLGIKSPPCNQIGFKELVYRISVKVFFQYCFLLTNGNFSSGDIGEFRLGWKFRMSPHRDYTDVGRTLMGRFDIINKTSADFGWLTAHGPP